MQDHKARSNRIHIFWSEEDKGHIAVAPDLPGCSAFGGTQQEALTELQSAIAAWLEAARASGNLVPEPSHPAVEDSFGGTIWVCKTQESNY